MSWGTWCVSPFETDCATWMTDEYGNALTFESRKFARAEADNQRRMLGGLAWTYTTKRVARRAETDGEK